MATDGGPAYPCGAYEKDASKPIHPGLSKLEVFALAAMQGMLSTSNDETSDMDFIIKESHNYAEAMLAEAERRRNATGVQP